MSCRIKSSSQSPAPLHVLWHIVHYLAMARLITLFLFTLLFNFIDAKFPQLSLPKTTGPHNVGTISTELLDEARSDPYAPSSQKRSLMIQFFYPTNTTKGFKLAPYMSAAAAQFYNQLSNLPNNTFEQFQGRSYLGAPITTSKLPVVLFSPGMGVSRFLYTAMVSNLASQGYLVVALDHPYDASIVEYPDGRVVPSAFNANQTVDDILKAMEVRSQDVRFVLNQLSHLASSKKIPGLSGPINVERVGMFGHSLGGATAANVMLNDSRIAAGFNMDGSFFGPVINQGLDKPFALMGASDNGAFDDDSWNKTWANLRSRRTSLVLANSSHFTFSDGPIWTALLNASKVDVPEGITSYMGKINGLRANTVTNAYITAFFNSILRNTSEPLLEKPDPQFPEIIFDRV
ncbi:uncharacterized protein VTP21DRAFT_4585 [Calcarisporiella thermophila]|uniref:uncharacterized protein n=1 Tax=Calcarisporiella thermophila TaxID=911321 RepID=UPI003743B39B